MSSPGEAEELDSGSASGLRAYLSATAFAGLAYAMQQLLISWLFVGILLLPADRVGVLQALIGIPGVLVMLWGGARADQRDPRRLLLQVYWPATLLPLSFALVQHFGVLSVLSVTLFGLGMSTAISYSSPAQQAILNRVSGSRVQQGVTAATSLQFVVQIFGLYLAGQMETLGLVPVLLTQAAALGVAGIMVSRLPAQPPRTGPANAGSAWVGIASGIRATLADRNVSSVLLLNFVSSIFNAGAFITVLPFIVKRLYNGDAATLSLTMMVFYAGATVSNLAMLRWMPFERPGRWFLLMQLSRVAILFLLFIQPSWPLVMTAVILWGLNMGVTTTLSRTIVQESAVPEYRGRILSVYSLGLIGSAPIGALVLGQIIEVFGELQALVPAMATSLVLFLFGSVATGIWSYRSPAFERGTG